tara:strand:+ start:7787 stop:8647 length:861 start_codon:yes stop_codon:yes gene_type:complete
MEKNIILLGASGQLGKTFCHVLKNEKNLQSFTKDELNICDKDSKETLLEILQPGSYLINAAAYTNVDLAEDEPDICNTINHESLNNLIDVCNARDSTLIHFSTDYVFDGASKEKYSENSEMCPINVYGKSKALGDKLIISKCLKYFIFRVSWVYSIYGKNFPKSMINLIKQFDEVKVIDDQFGVPTPTGLIVNIVKDVIKKNKNNYGIYNLCPDGRCSWYEIASFLNAKLTSNNSLIIPIPSKEFKTKALRPKNSLLRNDKIKKLTNLPIREWQYYIEEFYAEINK